MKIYINCFIILLFMIPLCILAVDVKEEGNSIVITTQNYVLHWNKPAQMGYMQAFIAGGKDTIIGRSGRAFYHSSDYGGWKDWGALQKWDILEKGGGKAVVQYVSRDAGTKEYTCVATYYDSVNYIKHEVTVKNVGDAAVTSFQSGHDPMFEINLVTEGMQVAAQPFPHVVYWLKDGYFGGIYGPEAQEARKHDWGGNANGRMDLVFDNKGKQLKKGESASIVYYVAFGKGKDKEALALASKVTEEPPMGKAVSPQTALSTTWGWIRSSY
ncbi:MAG: hypothetical protein ACUVWN_07415 [bacterium]